MGDKKTEEGERRSLIRKDRAPILIIMQSL